jgi:hypothetical protein
MDHDLVGASGCAVDPDRTIPMGVEMSIHPGPGAEIPPRTARIARAANPRGTTAMWVRDRLDGLWEDADFIAWYPRDGRPGISPAQLAPAIRGN